MNGIHLYFVNKLFLVGRYWDFNLFPIKPIIFTFLQYKSENTVGKGEIARNEQFLLFPKCFLSIWGTFCHFHQIRYCHLQTLSFWKSLKMVVSKKVFTCLPYKSFENSLGIGEIARNKQFLLSLQCFLSIWGTFCHFTKFEIVVCKLFHFG